jgi:uncharacterized protein YcnI
MLKLTLSVVALGVLASSAAFAHVTFENQQATIGSTYKAVLRVPHGCEGKATNVVRVQVPKGFTGVKAMPKPGWKLEMIKDTSAPAKKDDHGAEIVVIKEVVWSGGNLLDENYDEFVFRGSLAKDLTPNTTMYFPVVQECPDKAFERWIEIPADGKTAADYKKPAPGLKLLPKP